MKKFMIFFIIIINCFILIFTYYSYSNKQYNLLTNYSNHISQRFFIPDDVYNSDPENFELLKRVAKDNNLNIFRSVSYFDKESNSEFYDDYIYLVTDTSYLLDVKVSEGTFLSVSNFKNNYNSNLFVSTNEVLDDENQIGVIKSFGNVKNFSVKIMDSLYKKYPYTGYYKVETLDEDKLNSFLAQYAELINDKYEILEDRYIYTDYIPESDRMNDIILNYNYVPYLIILIFIVIILLMYYFINISKEISVFKLHGCSLLKIWYILFFKDILKLFGIVYILLSLIMLFIPNNEIEFIFNIYLNVFLIFLILFLISVPLLLYIHVVKINYCIKGKKPIKLFLIFNTFVCIISSVILIMSSLYIISNIKTVVMKKKNIEKWYNASDYGVLSISLGKYFESIINGGFKFPLDVPLYNIYPYLNNLGSIYINATSYEVEDLIINKEAYKEYINYITVNPNYLKLFKVYDLEGNVINISEDEPSSIYLVPEQYKDYEEIIINQFSDWRSSMNDLHTDYYGQESKFESQDIKLIYTKSGQEIFSFNLNVYPENNNNILDPVISVLTESNSVVPDRFYTNSSPIFYIKLIDQDPEKTYSYIYNTVVEYALEDNIIGLIQVNELVLSEISELTTEIKIIFAYLLVVLFILVLLTFENISLIFDINRYELFIKNIMGYNFMYCYSNLIYFCLALNLIEFIICIIFSLKSTLYINIFFKYIIFFSKILFELIIYIIFITHFKNKNKIEILKRG